ncbi:MAG TPA: hypothetical protein VIL49_06030 [Capillimicrobium sp.]
MSAPPLKRSAGSADERAVTLADRIAAQPGWAVALDVPTAIGPVALVAVGPGGVFVVESASALGARHPRDVPERPLMHAWALARHLREAIGPPVAPLLAVDARLDGLGGRRRGVHVVRSELAPNWLAERPAALSEPDRARLLARLGADVPRPTLAQRGPDATRPARATT